MGDLTKELCKRIHHRIDVRGYCVVYDHELVHVWPPEAPLHQKQIELIKKLAAQNDLNVIIRDTGLNATFKKKLVPREHESANERNGDTALSRLENAKQGRAP
ncbi:MAG TPA: hypothetical protein VGM66_10350 [Candidatus Udaeobacter sp.]|jgi:hypothetical protein